jgi:serine phosphatase RsbU (regulator of sigma subunit)
MKGNLARLVPAITRELREAVQRRARERAEDELRRTQEQFRVAHEIQQRLFPKEPPSIPPFDIAGASHPAEAAGGDYFDYVPMCDGTLGIVVADVAGHGVGPALLMAEARAYLRSLAMNATDVGEILTSANHALAEDTDLERYVTVMLTKLNPRVPSLVYASAGHPTCYVLDSSGNIKNQLQRTGVPLGVPPKAAYASAPPMALTQGDIVLLLTDGLEETQSPEDEFFGIQRILEGVRAHSAKTARGILEAIYDAVRQFSRHEPQQDDLTAVVVKVG